MPLRLQLMHPKMMMTVDVHYTVGILMRFLLPAMWVFWRQQVELDVLEDKS